MAAIDSSRYSDLCRLCASKTTLVMGLHLFQNDPMGGLVRKRIESCLPIQIHENDELPKMICENCIFKLNWFMDFRDRTVRTERLLLDLCKELHEQNKLTSQQTINVVSIQQEELLLVHQNHQEMLASHEIVGADEIDLSHLSTREQMMVGHEIILSDQTIDLNGHSLDNISIDHHELTGQDLSNHSLPTEESMSVGIAATHDRFPGNNLDLIPHQQLLSDQFRLQHDLHVNISTADEMVLGTPLSPVQNKMSENSQQHVESHGYSGLTEEKSLEYSSKHQLQELLEPSLERIQLRQESLKVEDENSSNSNNHLVENLNSNNSNHKGFALDPDKTSIMTVENISISKRPTDWLQCNICPIAMRSESEFETHIQSHFQKCDVCLAVFPNMGVLNAHRKEAHADLLEAKKPIITRLKRATLPIKKTSVENSDDSGGDFPDDNDNGDDFENDNSPSAPEKGGKRKIWSPKVCKECGKSYKTNYKLNEHMRKHTGEKPYKCADCEKEFRSKIGLAQHAAQHTGHYDYACPICGKGFQCKSYLMVHQRVHSDVKPYPCTTCGRNFKTKQSLLDHTNRHLGVKPYICDICGRGFITKGLCKAHQKVHTGLDNRKYSCKVCQKMFVSKSYLQTHLRIHTGEKPFICEVCGKGFLTKVDLKIHTTMHTGEKSYVCEICGKAFARRDALRCHRRSHTGERPYSCDLCGQTFTQFTPMAIHKRLHTGERPYACESCGKTFVSRSTMMSHAKKHSR